MKRYICELIGTMVLVLFGCGSAAIAALIYKYLYANESIN